MMNLELIITVGITLLVFGLLNVILLAVIYFMRRKASEVKTWPSAGGVILSSHIEYRSDSEGGDTAYPVVRYAYEVDGQTYQSTKISPGPEVGGSGAHGTVAKYSANKMVTVYYNPLKPAEAVIEKNAAAEWIMWLILGIFDVVLCCVVPVMIYFFGV